MALLLSYGGVPVYNCLFNQFAPRVVRPHGCKIGCDVRSLADSPALEAEAKSAFREVIEVCYCEPDATCRCPETPHTARESRTFLTESRNLVPTHLK